MNRKKFILSILVAIFLIASGLASLTLASAPEAGIGSHLSTATATVAYQNSPAGASSHYTGAATTGSAGPHGTFNTATPTTSGLIANAKALGVPMKYLYVPAIHSAANMHNGIVMPGYEQGPAPFGIGAYGIKNVSGTLQSYSYLTNGFQANLNVSNINAYDLNTYDPNGYTVQLNTILNGTTVMGISNYTYWTQNVMFFDTYAHQFEMVDNIWNFSSPTAAMPASTIYSHTAVQQPYPYAYIGVGPVVNNVSAPFNATLTLESAVVNGMSTVFFNYSLTFTNTSTGLLNTIGGTFDEVQFNSASGVQGYSAPMPMFRVDGSTVTPLGFIPYDAEVTLEGPGGGSNINFASISGNLTLHYNNSAGNYVNVPSAYNVGSETGETSAGIAESWSPNGVVRLSSGPSMIYGMWNVSANTGTTHFTGSLAPSNAFMFVAPGHSISVGPGISSQYGYVPMTTSGDYSFYLPTGTYYQEVMMSNYAVEKGALTSSMHVTLTPDTALGIYTPLYAMNNAQLANISTSGSGTLANPYNGLSNQPGYINPLFGMFSDYGFPVFSGMMIENTNMYIDFNNSASFQIMYQQDQSLLYMGALYGMGAIDYLNYVLYNTSNVSIYNAPLISGTIPANYEAGFYGASVILWNSTNDLIANSTFVLGQWMPYNQAILVYNPQFVLANNTIAGNYFLDEFYDFGIQMSSSGNLVYNNVFQMGDENAFTPTYDIWTGGSASYIDTWNVTPTATSSFYLLVNGYNLTGNILGASIMGGNYWNTYYVAPGTPFTDLGDITNGGDYAPIVPAGPYYPVLFYQMGLPAGQSWSVTMGGVTHTSTTSVLMFMAMPYLEYNFSLQTAGSMMSMDGPTSGIVYGYSDLVSRGFVFSPVYTLTVTDTGMPTGFQWISVLNTLGFFGSGNYSVTNQAVITFAPGEYISENSAVGSYYGFPDSWIYTGSEYLVPFFSNMAITEAFTTIDNPVNFSIDNLPTTATWTIDLYTAYDNGTLAFAGSFTGTGTNSGYGSDITLMVPFGAYEMVFHSAGYTLEGDNPHFVYFFPGNYGINTYFTAYLATPVTFNFQGLPSATPVTLELYSYNYYWDQLVTTTSSSVTVMVPTGTVDLEYYAVPGSSAYYSFGNDVSLSSGASSYTVNVPFYPVSPTQSTVTFSESGLSSGATWQVTLNGLTKTASAGSTISFTVAPGSYNYQVSSAGMVSPQSSGTVNAQSATQSVSVSFSPQTYSVTFIVAGLPANQTLNVTFNGQTQTTSGVGLVFSATAGTYSYSVGSVNGYTLASNASSLSIDHNTVVVLTFTPVKSTSAAVLMYLGYAGLVGLGALAGVLGAMFIPKMMGGKKGGS